MSPDLGWWAGLLATLAVISAIIGLLARAVSDRCASARDRRRVWRIATVALLLAVGIELAGLRPVAPLHGWSRTSKTATRTLQVVPVQSVSVGTPFVPSVSSGISLPESHAIWWPGWGWLGGMVILAVRGFAARAHLAWRCRPSIEHAPPRRETLDHVAELRARLGLGTLRQLAWAGLKGPIVFGIWRPTLVVPKDFEDRFSREQRRSILAHELSHLAAGDPAWLAVASGMTTLLWWNPLAWWTARELRRSSESAADEASQLFPGGRLALAESLVILGRELLSPMERTRLGAAGSGPTSELGRRVRALLGPESTGPVRRGRERLMLMIGVVMVGTVLLVPIPGGKRASLPRLLSTALADSTVTRPLENPTVRPGIPASDPYGLQQHDAVAPLEPDSFPPFPRPSLAYGQLPESSTRVALLEPSTSPIESHGFFSSRQNQVYVSTTPQSTGAPTATATPPPRSAAVLPVTSPMVASANPDAANPSAESLYTRTWRVDTERMFERLGITPAQNGRGTDGTPALQKMLSAAGVQLPIVTSGAKAPDPTGKAIFFRTTPGVIFARATPKELDAIERQVGTLNQLEEQVHLLVHFVEVTTVGGGEDTGLDRLFGQSPTNNPVPEITAPTGKLPGAGVPFSDRIQVEKLSIQGQAATLSPEQFAALREQLESRGGTDWLAGPGVPTVSGRQVQVAVQDIRSIVTGPRVIPESSTNSGALLYEASPIATGPVVEILPESTGQGWKLAVTAQVDEFMGYANPVSANRVELTTSTGAIKSMEALPRFRTRELVATAHLTEGQTLAMRGPEASQTIVFKDKVPVLGDIPIVGRLFRKQGTQSIPKRLYVFITLSTGNPGSPAAKP